MADEWVTPTDGYTAYDEWKHWSKDSFLATSEVDAAYFEGELNGLTLHRANVLEVGFGNGSFLAWARSLVLVMPESVSWTRISAVTWTNFPIPST